MIVTYILKKYQALEIPAEFFRNVICSFLYITIIIYCIYKDRLVLDYASVIENDRIQ